MISSKLISSSANASWKLSSENKYSTNTGATISTRPSLPNFSNIDSIVSGSNDKKSIFNSPSSPNCKIWTTSTNTYPISLNSAL